jgi:hypothetical protein
METLVRRAVKKAQMEVPKARKAQMGRDAKKLWGFFHGKTVGLSGDEMAAMINAKHLVIMAEAKRMHKLLGYGARSI